LTTRYIIDEFEFPMGASAGIALCPDHTTSPTDLLAYADTAMFVAKDKKLGHTVYTPDMTERLVEYRIMQEQLSRALDRNEFFLVYQPQVQLATGKVIGVEALLRWRHGGQVISPARFVPLLEKSREIIAVGRWIVRDACRQLREWNDAGYDVSVSINLSAVQFNDNDFFRYITSPIEEFQLDPRQLDFEITESLLVDDVNQATQRLTQLKMLGVSISIDDFGTGYSSLAYLRQFPLDRLKIDRAFVKDIPDDDDGVIARSIVVLAKALGLKVLAEGVETKAQLEFLQSLDCDECQGYLLNPPASAEEASKFFAIANPSSQLPLHLAVLA
jgi:EAL domain-containing protein (putative c-di-GMP-specific phosphodiesterase class I)